MAPFERDRHHPIPQKQSTDHIPDCSQLKICDRTVLGDQDDHSRGRTRPSRGLKVRSAGEVASDFAPR
jgi:hypothetical protein